MFRSDSKRVRTLLFLALVGFGAYSLPGQNIEAWPWQKNENSTVSILLFGDLNIQNRENPVEPFQYVLPTLNHADLRIGNLEGADDPG